MFNDKKIGLIIPTRFNSNRLPGKVFCDINGKLQIERIIDRAFESQYIDRIVLAVTDNFNENGPILDWLINDVEVCHKNRKRIDYIVGDHNNIIKRCLYAADFSNIDIIVDISHDCTFVESYLIDRLIERLFEYKADYSANCITRSFPNGFDIQVYTKEIYQKVYEYLDSKSNFTNWTNYWSGWNIWHERENIYPKPRFVNLEASPINYYPEWNLCLDTEDDYKLIEIICNHFENEMKFDYKQVKWFEIIRFLFNNRHLLEINKKSVPNRIDKQG